MKNILIAVMTEGRCSENVTYWHNCSIEYWCQFIIHWLFCHGVLHYLIYRSIVKAIKNTQALGTFCTTTVCLREWTLAALMNYKSYSMHLHSKLLYGGWLFCFQVQTNWWHKCIDSNVIYTMQQDIIHFIRPTTCMYKYIYVISVHSYMLAAGMLHKNTAQNTDKIHSGSYKVDVCMSFSSVQQFIKPCACHCTACLHHTMGHAVA